MTQRPSSIFKFFLVLRPIQGSDALPDAHISPAHTAALLGMYISLDDTGGPAEEWTWHTKLGN